VRVSCPLRDLDRQQQAQRRTGDMRTVIRRIRRLVEIRAWISRIARTDLMQW